MASSGETDPDNFNAVHLSKLYNFSFDNFHVVFDEDEDFLKAARKVDEEECLLFNVGKYSLNIFEEGKSAGPDETTVIHKDLQKFFLQTKSKCVIVYEKHADIFKLYKDHSMIMIDKWGRRVNDREKCQEIIIANF